MLEFLKYFFGIGETAEFVNFTPAHFAPILVAAAIIFAIYRFRDAIGGMKREYVFRYVLAFIMIVCEMSYFWRLVAVPSLKPNPVDHLPITVCGWVVIFGSYMLVGKAQTLFDITYFWAFSGSVFALITPTVITYTGPTRFRYYQFWGEHLLGYIALFYMIFVHKMRPTRKSFIKAYVGMIILAAIAYWANRLLGPGANYLYMAQPEETPSVLDILPPNFALRVLVMASIITIMFVLAYLPWYIKDKKKAKQSVLTTP